MTFDLKLYKLFDFLEFLVGSLCAIAAILGIITFFKNDVAGNILFSIISPLGACPKIHLLQKANLSKFETDSRAGKFFGE